jgi:hypothetical protein
MQSVERLGRDWPNWGCKHADDMEDLEYTFDQAGREGMRNRWNEEVEKVRQAHEDECVKLGVRPNEKWHRKEWFRTGWYLWDCRHAFRMKELEFMYGWCMDHEVGGILETSATLRCLE